MTAIFSFREFGNTVKKSTNKPLIPKGLENFFEKWNQYNKTTLNSVSDFYIF